MNNKIYNQWAEATQSMIDAFVNEDIDKAQSFKLKADNIFESVVREHEFFKQNLNNFGLLMPIIESKVAELYQNKENKPMKEFLQMMKEDKNLKSQYKFYLSMKNYTTNAPSKEYVMEALKDVKKSLNESSIKESNQKLVDFMKKYHITKNTNMISEEKKDFYNSCQYLLENRSNAKNLADVYDHIANVAEYIEQNPRTVVTEDKNCRKNILRVVNEFNKKYSMMEGKETEMFNILLETKNESDSEEVKSDKDAKKMKLLNDMKASCISKLEEMEEDASAEEKEQIFQFKSKISEMEYSEDTIVENITTLLAMRDELYEK